MLFFDDERLFDGAAAFSSTVISQTFSTPLAFAMILVLPALLAVILPFSTLATLSSDEFHSTVWSLPFTVAVIISVLPTVIFKDVLSTSIVGSNTFTLISWIVTFPLSSIACTFVVYSPTVE